MTNNDEILLLAMTFGDGHIRKNRPELSMKHCEAQKEYIEFKSEIIRKATGKYIKVSECLFEYNKKTCKAYRCSNTHEFYKTLRSECYDKCGNKIFTTKQLSKLTPEAIAIWFMDDGSLIAKKRNNKIHAYEIVISCCSAFEIDAQNIIDFFKREYNLNFTIKRNKNRFSVRCGTKEAKKFIEIVKPYIIPCMQYKINL